MVSTIRWTPNQGALREVKLLDPLSSAEIDALATAIVPRQVREGEVLIRQGDATGTASDTFFIIHQGEVVISKDVGDGSPPHNIITLHRGKHQNSLNQLPP